MLYHAFLALHEQKAKVGGQKLAGAGRPDYESTIGPVPSPSTAINQTRNAFCRQHNLECFNVWGLIRRVCVRKREHLNLHRNSSGMSRVGKICMTRGDICMTKCVEPSLYACAKLLAVPAECRVVDLVKVDLQSFGYLHAIFFQHSF